MSTIKATRGDTTIYRFTCVDAAGAAVDLSSATAALAVRRTITDPDPLIRKTSEDGLTLVVPKTGGLIDLEIEPPDTTGLTPGVYIWDLEVRLGDRTYTVDRGKLELTADVTSESFIAGPAVATASAYGATVVIS